MIRLCTDDEHVLPMLAATLPGEPPSPIREPDDEDDLPDDEEEDEEDEDE